MDNTEVTTTEEIIVPKMTAASKFVISKPFDGSKYLFAVGRRKTATATVRISKDTKASFIVNDKTIEAYFSLPSLVKDCKAGLFLVELPHELKITAMVKGGGPHAQAVAIRLAIARALSVFDPSSRTTFKKEGFLKRDPRKKERKKFGLLAARRAPQWAKR